MVKEKKHFSPEEFWRKWYGKDMLDRTKHVKKIAKILSQSFESIELIRKDLEKKKVDVDYLKAQALNGYLEDLADALYEEIREDLIKIGKVK